MNSLPAEEDPESTYPSAFSKAYPWTATIDRILSVAPDIQPTPAAVLMASDYSGQQSGSSHEVYCFCILDIALGPWVPIRKLVRESFLKDDRRLSFKGMNDRRQKAALQPFLEAADYLSGHVVTFAFHKDANSLKPWKGILENPAFSANWKAKPANDMVLKAIFAACAMKRWLTPGVDIYWVSDRDNSIANESLADDLHRLSSSIYQHMVQARMGKASMKRSEFFLGTSDKLPDALLAEDLISIADLAAGMTAEVVTAAQAVMPEENRGTRDSYWPSVPFSEKSETISQWFWNKSRNLAKTCIVADAYDDKLQVFKFDVA